MNYSVIQKLADITETIPADVRLIAVSKKVEVEKIKSVYEQGIKDFAENRLQDAISKQKQLADLTDICWHFIGHLQTNKAKKAIESFSWIHSVDSLKLAQKLDIHAGKALAEGIIKQSPQVCLQVKILPDENKYGWHVNDLWQDIPQLQSLKYLRVRGLMSILPLGLSASERMSAFQDIAKLAEEIRLQGHFTPEFDQLSMGMSGDYQDAIAAGATMIRLGSIIFRD